MIKSNYETDTLRSIMHKTRSVYYKFIHFTRRYDFRL